MKKQEVLKFLQKIKVYYPNFSTDGQMVKDEWTRKLEPYDFDDCCMKLDEHLAGEYQDRPPMPNWIIKYLKTSEEKSNRVVKKIICPRCEKNVDVEELDKHTYRCNSVYYIADKAKKIYGKEVNMQKLYEMEQEEFDTLYNHFIAKIIDKVPRIEAIGIMHQLYPNETSENIHDMISELANEIIKE